MPTINAFTTTEELQQGCIRFLDRAEVIRREHVTAAVVALGKAALEELYGGSWERVGQRGGAQDAPLANLLANFGDRLEWLGLSIDQIRTALRAYEVDRQLPPTSKGLLLPMQLRALAGVADPSDRIHLANQAAAERWTVEQIQTQVAQWRTSAGVRSKGGRKPLPPAIKAVRAAARNLTVLQELDVAALQGEARESTLAELRELLTAVQAQIAAVEAGADAAA